MKKLTAMILMLLLLSRCTVMNHFTGRDRSGTYIALGDIDDIGYIGDNVYMEGLIFSSYELSKENGTFNQGEVIWFDVPISDSPYPQEIEVVYDENPDGSDSSLTNRMDLTEADQWVAVYLDDDFSIELSDFK